MRHPLAPQSRHICLILRLRDIKMRLNKDEYKRKLKIFGLIFITLLLPFVISFANITRYIWDYERFNVFYNTFNRTYFAMCFVVDYFYQNKREIFSGRLYSWYMLHFYIHRNVLFRYLDRSLSSSFIL